MVEHWGEQQVDHSIGLQEAVCENMAAEEE
jgi:hypothetical protein